MRIRRFAGSVLVPALEWIDGTLVGFRHRDGGWRGCTDCAGRIDAGFLVIRVTFAGLSPKRDISSWWLPRVRTHTPLLYIARCSFSSLLSS